ncbi:helix-turn-helix domain-containing protein [Nocardia higoensis]|uniref:Helix-turn-helix domain-containing protein n=1 Tax=Nocardia higoensis TaxID=228599 RepID=A0ABS0D954_9NOCA|nr:helix-turn-helix domain-containing protein [Nocardia higoensis]
MTAVADRSQTVMGRVLLLLEPFRERDGLTLTELAERAGFPRSSAHRMLSQLVDVGWLRRNGTSYHLGPKMVELGSEARAHDRIYRAAAPLMYRLHKRTGMAVRLIVLEGDELLVLEQIGGRWAAAALRTRPGQRRRAQGAVEGAALLAVRAGRGPVLRECVVPGGSGGQVRCLTVGFEAGRDEIAALSLSGPAGRKLDGAVRDLASAVDSLASELARGAGRDIASRRRCAPAVVGSVSD